MAIKTKKAQERNWVLSPRLQLERNGTDLALVSFVDNHCDKVILLGKSEARKLFQVLSGFYRD